MSHFKQVNSDILATECIWSTKTWSELYCESSNRKVRLSFRKTWPPFFVPRVPWEPFAPPHPFNAIYLNVQFSEKTGAKIIQSISAKKRFSFPRPVDRSGRGLSAVKMSVSPLDQWLKTPRYVHVSCTCNHNLPYGFKGNTKSRETWQRAVPAPNGKITEDFHEYHLDIALHSRTSSCQKPPLLARRSFPMWGEIQINVTERKRTEKGPFFGSGQTLRKGKHQHLLTETWNNFVIG